MMPGMDGFEVLERMNRLGIIEELPVIMISAESSPGFITRAYDFGAADYVSRPFESSVVQRRVKNTITLYAKQKRLVNTAAGRCGRHPKRQDISELQEKLFFEETINKKEEGVSVKETDGMDFSMLNSIGINTENAVERFMGNEALYVKMLKKFLDDKTYSALTAAVSENSRQASLEASHTLKGICGNLSFEKMYALFSEQVVLMRADKWDEAYAMMTEIAEQYDILTKTLRTWIDMQ